MPANTSSVGAGRSVGSTARSRINAHQQSRVQPSVVARSQQQHAAQSQAQTLIRRGDLFGREQELLQLEHLRTRLPASVLAILGPVDCGKSAVLHTFARSRDSVVEVNLRMMGARPSSHFFDTILDRLMQAAPPAVRPLAAARVGGRMLAESPDELARRLLDSRPVVEDLGPFIKDAWALLGSWSEARRSAPADQPLPWPMLIVDEADVLATWQDEYPEQLAALLRFFIAVSKQRCHVLLATSDWTFPDWLQDQGVHKEYLATKVIGNFPEDEARDFFTAWLQCQVDVHVDDAAWSAVHQVCGGNAGSLVALASLVCEAARAAEASGNDLDWDAVLKHLVGAVYYDTEGMANPAPEQGWTAKQYAAVALALLEAPSNAVPVHDVQLLLGRLEVGGHANSSMQLPAGREVLDRLVWAKALAVRPHSPWARDIPAAALPAGERVVTATTPACLHCMRRLEQQLRKIAGNLTH